MNTARRNTERGFSMIELVIVVAVMGIIAAIAVPKFADAASGRKIQAAKKQLLADIKATKLRARATSKQHTLKFFLNENMYVIVEGNEIDKNAIIIARDFDEDPYNLGIQRTSLGGDEVLVITPFGDLTPPTTVRLQLGSHTHDVILDGIADPGYAPVVSATAEEAKEAADSLVGSLLKLIL
tara:strand:- start:17926 stop:18471 length:546 start_codon:yes stop_codon:yes gene_type:complete